MAQVSRHSVPTVSEKFTDGQTESGDTVRWRTRVELQNESLDALSVRPHVAHPSCGAVARFDGTTRDFFSGKQVLRLEYEAYSSMAVSQMHALCDQARAKWPSLGHIAVWHRLGECPVMETSIVVAVASPHREEALAALTWLVDELKASVAVWKKECYADGSVWKSNKEFDPTRCACGRARASRSSD
ncbi:MAG: hypothetical protein MHM6MM_005344 [Cercozoa sp. M6MM]